MHDVNYELLMVSGALYWLYAGIGAKAGVMVVVFVSCLMVLALTANGSVVFSMGMACDCLCLEKCGKASGSM